MPLLSTGHNNGTTLWGSYTAFVPGHGLVAYYHYASCDDYLQGVVMTTANQSIPNNPGNGTTPPIAITGLSPDITYCAQACVVDLDANATKGDPTGGSLRWCCRLLVDECGESSTRICMQEKLGQGSTLI